LPIPWRPTIGGYPVHEEDVLWAASDDRPPLKLGYVIIPPTTRQGVF
jgi:hypothetical protein